MSDDKMPGLRLHSHLAKTYEVGDECHIYMSEHRGETTPGKVVSVLNLPGWGGVPNYVVEVEIGAPDPVLEVRCPLSMRARAIVPMAADDEEWVGNCAPFPLPRSWLSRAMAWLAAR